MEKLLSRDNFRQLVFSRDNFSCVICSNKEGPHDAHHIIERRLWPDGGYYLSNGATVCNSCHLKCESTDISVEEVREKAKITKPIIPPHLYYDQQYDKWGNIILPNGQRLKGDLFWDESVQKILANHIHKFVDKVKYPRTYHLPWSKNITEDDRVLESLDNFLDKEVVVTIKMDGENTTLYRDGIHARSVDSRSHPSRNWVKNFHSTIVHDIPDGWRICGENLYAKHSISYDKLDSYFLGFSIWDERNNCLDWNTTLEYFQLLGITPVPVVTIGIWDDNFQKTLVRLAEDSKWESEEGYVVRLSGSFPYSNFRNSVAKFVRKNHVQTTKHWMHGQEMIPNKLKSNN